MSNKLSVEIIEESRTYDDYLKIDRAIIKEIVGENETTYPRSKIVRPDAVAVILYNSDEDTVVLVKQYRYPTQGKVNGDIYEIIAGKIDENEEAIEAAVREVQEEVGYKLTEDKLLYQTSFFASPGYSDEIIHLYAASVTNSDKISNGGGVEGEHENIEIYHIPASEFFNMFRRGEIADAKSIIGANALWHLRNDDRVKVGLKYFEELQLENSKSVSESEINEEEENEE